MVTCNVRIFCSVHRRPPGRLGWRDRYRAKPGKTSMNPRNGQQGRNKDTDKKQKHCVLLTCLAHSNWDLRLPDFNQMIVGPESGPKSCWCPDKSARSKRCGDYHCKDEIGECYWTEDIDDYIAAMKLKLAIIGLVSRGYLGFIEYCPLSIECGPGMCTDKHSKNTVSAKRYGGL